MESRASNSARTVFRISGIAVTVLSAVGVAAIMGCTPKEDVVIPQQPAPAAQAPAQAPAARAPAGPTQAQIEAKARAQAQLEASNAQAAQAQAKLDAEAKAQAEARARAEGRAQGRAQERAQDRAEDRARERARDRAEDRARERAQERHADNTPDRGRCRDCGVIESVREIEKSAKSGRSYEITVRFYDGSRRAIYEARAPEWRTGDRVRIVNGVIRPNA